MDIPFHALIGPERKEIATIPCRTAADSRNGADVRQKAVENDADARRKL